VGSLCRELQTSFSAPHRIVISIYYRKPLEKPLSVTDTATFCISFQSACYPAFQENLPCSLFPPIRGPSRGSSSGVGSIFVSSWMPLKHQVLSPEALARSLYSSATDPRRLPQTRPRDGDRMSRGTGEPWLNRNHGLSHHSDMHIPLSLGHSSCFSFLRPLPIARPFFFDKKTYLFSRAFRWCHKLADGFENDFNAFIMLLDLALQFVQLHR